MQIIDHLSLMLRERDLRSLVSSVVAMEYPDYLSLLEVVADPVSRTLRVFVPRIVNGSQFTLSALCPQC